MTFKASLGSDVGRPRPGQSTTGSPERISRRGILAGFAGGFLATVLVACQEAVAPAAPPPAVGSPTPVNQAVPTVPSSATAIPTTAAISPTVTPAVAAPTATAVPIDQPTATAIPSPLPRPTETAIPTSAERLQPGGPPRDPGPLDWAHPGPYLGSGFRPDQGTGFSSKQPLVTTYYFYWDDLTDPAHRDPDRSLHPVDQDHYSFLNVGTHLRQFEDMQAAGIDFALAVYWGEPGHPGRSSNFTPGHYWSTEGIPPIVEALDQLASVGRPFKIGMFYDTTILANADLTTPEGQAYFYVNVRDFYSRIPPRHWATIDGKPIVWLYDTLWVARFDQSTFDNLTARFAQDFAGLRPYVVREWEWYQSKGVQPAQTIKTDNLYGWGAAPNGFNPDTRFGVAEVGPGFDNTGNCHDSPGGNCIHVDRENGAYYARALAAALRSGRKIIAIETWNEFDESTGIADTVELGRTYINLTRTYADAFHAGRRALA